MSRIAFRPGAVPVLTVLLAVASVSACAPAAAVQPGEPLPGLDTSQRQQFDRGRALFQRTFTPETGLGPIFNAASCGECHESPVTGGKGDEVEIHVAMVRSDGSCDPLTDKGGPVIQQHVTPALQAALGIDSEPAPAGVTQAHRTTPDIFGFGLLDAVPDEEILDHADPDDRDHDGISGRPNRDDKGHVGRFGRKAQVAHLREFNSGAFLIEVGVTSPEQPNESTVGGAPLPAGVDPAPDPEVDARALDDLDAYVRLLAPPPALPLDRESRRGGKLFRRIGCGDCHVPILRTGDSPIAALSHQKVAAYTDLLLHDMGPDLADICLNLATPSEFRTEPLMGLHLMTQFLHDGRAKSIEESVRLHAGESLRSRELFEKLDENDRKAVLAFLGRL